MHQLKEKAIHNFLTIPGIHLAQLSTDVCLLFVQKKEKNVSVTLIEFNYFGFNKVPSFNISYTNTEKKYLKFQNQFERRKIRKL